VEPRLHKHISDQELKALVPWPYAGQQKPGVSTETFGEAARHVESCADCARKVAKYREFVNELSKASVSGAAPPGADCPRDVDWYEVAVGLWPEMKARQLMMHAALCEHCGPLLRAAMALNQEPTAEEESFLAQLAAPRRPDSPVQAGAHATSRWRLIRWLAPATLVFAMAGVVAILRMPLSGGSFAEFAVNAHRQNTERKDSALDFRSDSPQMLNAWFQTKLPFALALPAAPDVPGEEQPFQLEGARALEIGGKPAVYVAYRVQKDSVGLIVTPDSVATASGGITVDYQKLSFHYRTVENYKVVTWTLHGRTYALVSQEGNDTQRSCMVCHSVMRDRDLSPVPTPLGTQRSALHPMWQ
jgi:hypothetical protein